MRLVRLALLSLLSTAISAWPRHHSQRIQARQLPQSPSSPLYSTLHAAECEAITNVTSALTAVPDYQMFCSSQLSMPIPTITVTNSRTITTTTLSLVQLNETALQTSTSVIFETSTVESGVTSLATALVTSLSVVSCAFFDSQVATAVSLPRVDPQLDCLLFG